ncbi:MAG: T9SS type A sorting domain-containing protein [Bacteroidota bacterium]
MKKLYSLLACCAIAGAAMAQTRYIDPVFPTVDITKDLTYGTGRLESGTIQDLKWDLYKPAGDTKTDRPMIIIAHGGSLIAEYGDKTDGYIVDFATAMAKKGYVVAAITYREGWAFNPLNTQEQNSRAILPAVWRAIQDYKTAIRFFKKSAAEGGNPYGIRQDLIIGGGFGLGGYLPMNAMILDVGSEVKLPELMQKNPLTGNPTTTPYIDTTKADLGGIWNTAGGSTGYSFRLDLVLNISGAIATPKCFDLGVNPKIISIHSDQDEATPYKTDIVRAAGIFAVIQVHGSYVVNNKLFDLGPNKFWTPEERDGYKVKQGFQDYQTMYTKGLYTFIGKPYMWSTTTDTYDATYDTQFKTEMDTVTTFSAYRMEKWLREEKGVSGIKEISYKNNDGAVKVFPNPAKDVISLQSTENGKLIREVDFLDLNGKLVKNALIIGGDSRNINISGMATGIYTMKIYFDDAVITDKLVIE